MKVDSRSDVRTIAMHGKHSSSCKRPRTCLVERRTGELRMVQVVYT